MPTFKNHLLKNGYSQESIKVHHRHLYYFLEWAEDNNTEPENTTYTDLLLYIKNLQQRGIKQRTVQLYINSLKHYFDWQKTTEQRTDNPAKNIDIKGIKRNHLYHILKKQELEQLYENHPNTTLAQKRNKVITGLLIWQGLNTTELKRLEEKDLKLREGNIYIAGTRKSNERELKLESAQIMDLMEYTLQTRKELLNLNHKTSDKLLISSGSSHHLSNSIQKLTTQLKRQNPSITSLQQIRASVITYWLKTYNLREAQYKAGHRYVSSTESYLINDLEDLSEEITKYHPI